MQDGMLVLSRKPGQTIIVGDREIEITVLSVNGNQVRIGTRARSAETPIHREEIYNKLKNTGEL